MSGTDRDFGARARWSVPVAAVLLSAVWAPAALAFMPAVVTSTAHLRAGPSTFYPIVSVLGPGTPVQLFGCEPNFGWCDVQQGLNRGWVDAWLLQAAGPGGPVVVASSAPMLGLPIVTFTIGNYWDTWYRGRPWYSNRAVYVNYWNRFPRGRPPPRPRPRPRPPPMVRPPPRPPVVRPPPAARPPVSRPPSTSRPPASGRPPPGGDRPGGGNRSGGGDRSGGGT